MSSRQPLLFLLELIISSTVSEAYNFTSPGEGTYSFEALENVFYNVGDNGEMMPIYADTQAHSVSLSGQLAIAPSRVSKRAMFNECSSSQQSALNSAAAAAKTYATSALSYANSHTSATSKYTTWFGTFTTARHNTVVSHYSRISSSEFNTFTFDCTCTDSGTYAYVYPNKFVPAIPPFPRSDCLRQLRHYVPLRWFLERSFDWHRLQGTNHQTG